MVSKATKRNLNTFLLVMIIIGLSVPLIVFSASGGSSSGGCCSGGCCSGGCCGGCCGDSVEDTDSDGLESTEDITPPAPPPKIPNICDTKHYKSTKIEGLFQQTNLSDHFEYTYSYTIYACKESVSYRIYLDGLKRTNIGTDNVVPINSSVEISGTFSSQSMVGFENKDIFNQMCIEQSDTTLGTNGKLCYKEK